jgi:putative transposase
MPRIARVVVPDIPYHVTQRGNYKQDIFLDDKDKFKYLSLVKEHSVDQKVEILAYCLMTNHVHFALVPLNSDSLGKMFNQVSMRYSQYFNKKLGKRGHLWQDRYFSCPLDKDHLYEVFRYIENNPVNAGIVRSAEDYYWSSARIHLFEETSNDDLLSDYTKYLMKIDDWREYLSEGSSDTFVLNLKQCTKSGRPAGSKDFMEVRILLGIWKKELDEH